MLTAALGLSSQHTRAVLEAGTLAPSVHNSQPWLFEIQADRLLLFSDPTRRLPAADPDDRELRLACGAALLNIRLTLLHHGIRPRVTIHPARPDHLIATIERAGDGTLLPNQAALVRAIPRRRTNRKPFLEQPVESTSRHALVTAAEDEYCRLRIVVDPQQRAELHRLLVRAHRQQMSDPRWQTEFTAWMNRSPQDREGVTLASSGPRPELQDAWVLRDFGLGRAPARTPGKDFESDPLIAILTSYVDDEVAQVQAGEALQRVLLTATSLGLSASFLSQLIEVGEVRAELRHHLGGRLHPQAAVRIGFGSPVPPVPRRPVRDCLRGERVTDTGVC